MEWLLILALGAWLIAQHRALSRLHDRVDRLELEKFRPQATPFAETTLVAVTVEEPAPEPPVTAAPQVWAAALAEAAPQPSAIPDTDWPYETASAKPKRTPDRDQLAHWLSEHGLAWLGGGALMLGGLFLVTYAAQRGIFTPALRIIVAIVVGAMMVAASEVVLRFEQRWQDSQAVAASLLAGAGAATLYGAVWAADRLYGFIGLSVAGPCLALISGGLFALALRHGGSLALLALAGAYLTPLVSNEPNFDIAPLAAFLLLILGTGHAVAGLRRWGAVGWAASAGAVIWAIATHLIAKDTATALLLVAAPSFALTTAALRRRREQHDVWPTGWDSDLFQKAPAFSLAAAAVAATAIWSPLPASHQAVAATSALVLLAGVAATRRLIAAEIQAGVFGLATLSLVSLLLKADVLVGPAALTTTTLVVSAALALGGAIAFGAGQTLRGRACASAGAVGATLSLALVAAVLHPVDASAAWPLGVGVVGLSLISGWLGRRHPAPGSDWALAIWIWGTGYLWSHAAIQLVPIEAKSAALGGLALAAGALHARLKWRGLGSTAVATGLAALATIAYPTGALALSKEASQPVLILATLAAALLVWLSGRIVRRSDNPGELPTALSTIALAILLCGAFFLLRVWSSGAGPGGLDTLTEASLRTALLLISAFVSARASDGTGLVARWRVQSLLWLGAVHGLAFQIFALNPMGGGRIVLGPPILDTLLVAYLAPATLLLLCARRKALGEGLTRDLCAGLGLVFGFIWALLIIRRLYQGPSLWGAIDDFGRSELATYGLLLLVVANVLLWKFGTSLDESDTATRRRQWSWLAACAFLIVAAVIYSWTASPWWGPIRRPMDSLADAGLLLALYAAAVPVWLELRRNRTVAQPAKILAILQGFVLLTLGLRFAFHGVAFASATNGERIETWAFSALWAVYGLGTMLLGVRRSDAAVRWTGMGLLLLATAKVFLFDMARLDGVVRAASFLAVGALLVLGAVAARRFQAATRAA